MILSNLNYNRKKKLRTISKAFKVHHPFPSSETRRMRKGLVQTLLLQLSGYRQRWPLVSWKNFYEIVSNIFICREKFRSLVLHKRVRHILSLGNTLSFPWPAVRLKQWAVSTERKNKHLSGPVEFDGLCSVGQTVGRVPGSVGEPSSSPRSFFGHSANTRREGQAGSEVLFPGLAWSRSGPGHAAVYLVRYMYSARSYSDAGNAA